MLPFALNHMTTPRLGYEEFLTLSRMLGCAGVEFRNDLGGALFGGDAPERVAAAARDAGQTIFALAEVKCFNDWSDTKAAEADALIETAVSLGAEAISLIPRNDGKGRGNGERQAHLRLALRELGPRLEEAGLIGLVEPLGFEICSLRFKSEAVDAVEALGLTGRVKLVHDTFHHHLAGGGEIFPAHTGIVHISGVTDPTLSISEMRDAHRVHVDARDRLGNIEQLQALQDGGYSGPVSVEVFAPEVHGLTSPGRALETTFAFIRSRLQALVD